MIVIASKKVGEFTHYTVCRFCGSSNIFSVIDLGFMPLAGGFIKKSDNKFLEAEKQYPLTVVFCKDCYLLQCDNAIDKKTLFSDYFYVSSSIGTLVEHFKSVAKDLAKKFKDPKRRFIVEIGCNDGAFIDAVGAEKFRALGVDPATNIVKPLIKKGMPIINDFFSEKLAKKIVGEYGYADAIYSFHALAHIEDMLDVVRGIKALLKPDGFLAFEVHYLGDLLNGYQYDMIYHEHQFYYSLLSLTNLFRQFDMEIFDVKKISVRAGSIMYFVQNKSSGKRKILQSVKNLLQEEKRKKLDKKATYIKFGQFVNKTKRDLQSILKELKRRKKLVVGYGASGRGTIIMNYCNLTKDVLDFVVDDAPAKQGALTPGNHLEIKSSQSLMLEKVSYAVLFAWPFLDEVKKRNKEFMKNGGKFILPLPKVKVIGTHEK